MAPRHRQAHPSIRRRCEHAILPGTVDLGSTVRRGAVNCRQRQLRRIFRPTTIPFVFHAAPPERRRVAFLYTGPAGLWLAPSIDKKKRSR